MVIVIEKLEILKENNDKLVVDYVSAFSLVFNEITHNFAIVTSNELDQNGLVKLMVSEVSNDTLVKISDEALWGEVKNVMRDIISSSSYNYTYITIPKSIKAKTDFARVIAVQEAAKTQLISDYMAKTPTENVAAPVSDSLIDNPAIYPTENAEISTGSEITPGIVVDTPVNTSNEEIKAVNVMDAVKKEPTVAEPEVSMDELVKNAMEKSEEPTNFDKTTEEDKLVVDATSLMRELENYIRLVVKDEINKSK